MFLRCAIATVLSLLGLPAAAQCTGDSYLDQLSARDQAALTATVAAMPYAEGIIWTAQKDDRQITVVGTMHIYDPRLEPIHDGLRDTIAGADLVLVEATPEDEIKLQNMVAADPSRIFIIEGPSLRDLLDDDTWDLVVQAAQARNIPGFMAAKMQPWYLSMMLSIPVCASAELMEGARGLDHMIMADAIAARVPLQGLEPFTTLFDIFQNDPIEDQIDMLMVSLLAPDQQQQMFVATLDRYFAQDVGRLWELSRFAMANIPGVTPAEAEALFAETEAALLIDRNRNWMPVIADAAARHDQLVIAVGAAHLIGTDGVLQLLENDGWTLTRSAAYSSP